MISDLEFGLIEFFAGAAAGYAIGFLVARSIYRPKNWGKQA